MIVGQETKIEGRWWVTGQSGSAYFGTLTHSQSNLQLIVKIPQDLNVDEVVIQSVNVPTQVPDVIIGRNAHNKPVTLFGCFCRPGSSEGLRTIKIDAIAGINGLELAGWNEPAIRAVSIRIDPVSIWLGGKTLVPATLNDGSEAFSLPAATDLSFHVCDDVEFRIWCSTGFDWREDETCFTQDSTVWLQFDEPRSPEALSDKWIPWVNRLFSLLLGTGIRPQSITCYREKFFGEQSKPLAEKGELLRKGGKPPTQSSDISSLEMITRYPELSADLAKIIKRWSEVAERYDALVDLFAVVAFNRSLHAEAQFLFLVQALEVYHARCAAFDGANNKHLGTRLSEIFSHHLDESTKILGSDPNLSEKIRYTRNHLTHHTGDKTSPKLLKSNELVRINWNLRTFVWVCLLKEIGLSGAPINRLMRKYGNTQFITLG